VGRLVDLSHVIEEGMPTYPDIPAPGIGAILKHEESAQSYQGKAEFWLGRFDLPGNTGTYLDAPFHRYRDGADLSAIDLERMAAVPGVVVDPEEAAGPLRVELEPEAIRGRAVLVRTGWDRRWGTDAYWEPGPYLSPEAVDRLVGGGPAVVGVDFANVDDTSDPARPAHTRLLGAGILIVEHLTGLEALPTEGFTFTSVPPRIVGGASFPVRAFADVVT
jgi:kynurenine formamidase